MVSGFTLLSFPIQFKNRPESKVSLSERQQKHVAWECSPFLQLPCEGPSRNIHFSLLSSHDTRRVISRNYVASSWRVSLSLSLSCRTKANFKVQSIENARNSLLRLKSLVFCIGLQPSLRIVHLTSIKLTCYYIITARDTMTRDKISPSVS